MITGQALGDGYASTASGMRVHYRLVKPDKPSLGELAQESKRWQQLAAQYRAMPRLPKGMARRASFADEVLATVGVNTLKGTCCNLIAQADDGRVLGAVYFHDQSPTEGYLDLVAVAPDQIPGAPNPAPLRGVGTGMVAAVAQEHIRKGATRIYLKPLDDEAEAFWKGRGFHACPPPEWRLCAEGPEIRALVAACELRPDCGDTGDCVSCGLPATTEAVRVPALRASMAR